MGTATLLLVIASYGYAFSEFLRRMFGDVMTDTNTETTLRREDAEEQRNEEAFQ